MTTELKRFTEAYATMTVAAYEPLILRWISLIGIRFISNSVAYRLPKAAAIKLDGKTPSSLALSKTLRKPLPAQIDFEFRGQEMRVPIDIHGRAIPPRCDPEGRGAQFSQRRSNRKRCLPEWVFPY
jgi:hypothetical protein